jgi:hypothetical protein
VGAKHHGKEILRHAVMSMNCEDHELSDITQSPKDKNSRIPLTGGTSEVKIKHQDSGMVGARGWGVRVT